VIGYSGGISNGGESPIRRMHFCVAGQPLAKPSGLRNIREVIAARASHCLAPPAVIATKFLTLLLNVYVKKYTEILRFKSQHLPKASLAASLAIVKKWLRELSLISP
jgi:hypothetical protein